MPVQSSFGGPRLEQFNEWSKDKFWAGANFAQKGWKNLGKSGLGRLAQQGIAMDFGFYRKAGPKSGFQFMGGAFEGIMGQPAVKGTAGFHGTPSKAAVKGGWDRFTKNIKGMGKGSMARGAGAFAGKAIAPGISALFVYQGFKHGGISGGINAAIENAKMGIAWEIGASVLGGAMLPITAGVAIAAGAGIGYYQLGEAAQRYGRKLRKVEMGAEVVDRFGTGATLRQRSLMALNNTHVNGRMALGNEAALIHAPMF